MFAKKYSRPYKDPSGVRKRVTMKQNLSIFMVEGNNFGSWLAFSEVEIYGN